jgi:hypothetical protein
MISSRRFLFAAFRTDYFWKLGFQRLVIEGQSQTRFATSLRFSIFERKRSAMSFRDLTA